MCSNLPDCWVRQSQDGRITYIACIISCLVNVRLVLNFCGARPHNIVDVLFDIGKELPAQVMACLSKTTR
jgi:hypothetical protein